MSLLPEIIMEPGNDIAEPIFFSKACYQFGFASEVGVFTNKETGKSDFKVKLPPMTEEMREKVIERAKFLQLRSEQGLPVDPLPSGRFPDSEEEYADAIPLSIQPDTNKGTVCVGFGRAITTIDVTPAMARTIALMLMGSAATIESECAPVDHGKVNIARVRVPDSTVEKEGTISLLDFMAPSNMVGSGGSEGHVVELSQRNESSRIEDFPIIGTCSLCGELQYQTPSGPTCKTHGHGGAITETSCEACDYFPKEPSGNGYCESGDKMPTDGSICHSWSPNPTFKKE